MPTIGMKGFIQIFRLLFECDRRTQIDEPTINNWIPTPALDTGKLMLRLNKSVLTLWALNKTDQIV